MILDTDVLIYLMQGDDRTMRKIDALEEERTPLAISSMSLFELHHSVGRVRDADRRRRAIDAVLETRHTYPADAAVMKKAGRIDGRLTSDGRAIGMGDAIIGATALVQEEPVLTRDVDHFDRIDDLEVESV